MFFSEGENLIDQLSGEGGYKSKEKPARNATTAAALSLASEAIDSTKSTTAAEPRTDAKKKSAEIFIPSPSESIKFYKNRNGIVLLACSFFLGILLIIA